MIQKHLRTGVIDFMVTTNRVADKQIVSISLTKMDCQGVLSLFFAITIVVFSIFHTLTWSQIDIAEYRTIAWLIPMILTFNCFFILLSGAGFAITTPTKKLLLISTGYTFFLIGLKNISFHGLAGLFIWEATSAIFFGLWLIKLFHFLFKKYTDHIIIFLFIILAIVKNPAAAILQKNYSYLYSPYFNNSGLFHIIIIKLFAVLILVALSYIFIRKTKLTYGRLALTLLMLVILVYGVIGYNFSDDQLQIITTLPVGFLIGDYFDKYHAFGLITWLPIFLMGYLLSKYYLLKLEFFSKAKIIIFFMLSIAVLLNHYWNFRHLMDPKFIADNKIDTNILSVAFAVLQDKSHTFISFFAAVFVCLTTVFYIFRSQLSRLIEKSISLPQSLLHIYVFTTAFGYRIHSFFSALSQGQSIILTILFLLFFYFLIIRFDYWLLRKKIRINLRS